MWRLDINFNHQLPKLLSRAGPTLDGRVGTAIQCGTFNAPLNFGDERHAMLERMFNCTDFREFHLLGEDLLDEALRLIATKTSITSHIGICLNFVATAHNLDCIIAYFRTTALTIGRATILNFRCLRAVEWPTLCPKEDGYQRYPNVHCYKFFFVNSQSGRSFQVVLEYGEIHEATGLKSMTFLFDTSN